LQSTANLNIIIKLLHFQAPSQGSGKRGKDR